jgi:hypothetical protein
LRPTIHSLLGMGRPRVHSPRPVAVASSLSVGSGLVVILSFGAHLTMSARFHARAPSPYPAGYPRRPPGGGDHLVSVSRCVSAAGIRFLVILFPPGNWAFLTVGLPARPMTSRTQTGFPRFARTSNDRGGCPLYPGDDGAHPAWPRSQARACRISAARPCTPPQPPSMRGSA